MKLLIVDIGSLFKSTNRRWPDRRLDYQKIERLANADVSVAIGSQRGGEAGKFIHVLRKIGYLVHYEKVEDLDMASGSVNITLRLMAETRATEVILGSTDSNLVPTINYLSYRSIPVSLLALDPSRLLAQSVNKLVPIEEEHLLPLPDKTKVFPNNVKGQMDADSNDTE